jgi:hypothetical protein
MPSSIRWLAFAYIYAQAARDLSAPKNMKQLNHVGTEYSTVVKAEPFDQIEKSAILRFAHGHNVYIVVNVSGKG